MPEVRNQKNQKKGRAFFFFLILFFGRWMPLPLFFCTCIEKQKDETAAPHNIGIVERDGRVFKGRLPSQPSRLPHFLLSLLLFIYISLLTEYFELEYPY